MKKKNKKIEENHTHIHIFGDERGNFMYPIKKIIYFMILLIFLVNCIAWIDSFVVHDVSVYNVCVDGCTENGFYGLRVGSDNSQTSCVVEEIDNTACMKNCNDLFLKLKGIENE